jgi:hypothetical protein
LVTSSTFSAGAQSTRVIQLIGTAVPARIISSHCATFRVISSLIHREVSLSEGFCRPHKTKSVHHLAFNIKTYYKQLTANKQQQQTTTTTNTTTTTTNKQQQTTINNNKQINK